MVLIEKVGRTALSVHGKDGTAPKWLETDWILAAFAKRKHEAQTAYRRFVAEGKKQPSP